MVVTVCDHAHEELGRHLHWSVADPARSAPTPRSTTRSMISIDGSLPWLLASPRPEEDSAMQTHPRPRSRLTSKSR